MSDQENIRFQLPTQFDGGGACVGLSHHLDILLATKEPVQAGQKSRMRISKQNSDAHFGPSSQVTQAAFRTL